MPIRPKHKKCGFPIRSFLGGTAAGSALIAVAFSFLLSAGSVAHELAECEQADRAWLALRICSAVIESNEATGQDRSRAYTRRGHAWITEDDIIQAAQDFTRAIEADAHNVRAYEGRAKANALLGQHGRAAEDWTAAMDKSPQEINLEPSLLERGASWLAAGRTDAAMADFDHVITRNPTSIEGHIGRANVFAALNEREKALAEFAAAEAIDARDPATYVARAEAAERWGDIPLAIENYSSALKLKTTVWTARKALKRLGIDTPP